MNDEISKEAYEVISIFRDIHFEVLESGYQPVRQLNQYTSLSALEEIVSAGQFRLTNVLRFSDTMDTANGRAHVVGFLEKLHCDGALNSIGKVALRRADSTEFSAQLERILESTFAASFTRSDQNEEMINEYAGPDGCCIGFNDSFVDEIRSIPSSFDDGGSHFSFYQMTYDFSSQRAMLLQVYEEFSSKWDSLDSSLKEQAQELVGQLLYQSLLIVSFHFKGSEFAFEDEVRLLFSYLGNHESLSEKIKIIKGVDGLVQSCALNLDGFPRNINSISIFSQVNKPRAPTLCGEFGMHLNTRE